MRTPVGRPASLSPLGHVRLVGREALVARLVDSWLHASSGVCELVRPELHRSYQR